MAVLLSLQSGQQSGLKRSLVSLSMLRLSVLMTVYSFSLIWGRPGRTWGGIRTRHFGFESSSVLSKVAFIIGFQTCYTSYQLDYFLHWYDLFYIDLVISCTKFSFTLFVGGNAVASKSRTCSPVRDQNYGKCDRNKAISSFCIIPELHPVCKACETYLRVAGKKSEPGFGFALRWHKCQSLHHDESGHFSKVFSFWKEAELHERALNEHPTTHTGHSSCGRQTRNTLAIKITVTTMSNRVYLLFRSYRYKQKVSTEMLLLVCVWTYNKGMKT
jgi:hypothetical protein